MRNVCWYFMRAIFFMNDFHFTSSYIIIINWPNWFHLVCVFVCVCSSGWRCCNVPTSAYTTHCMHLYEHRTIYIQSRSRPLALTFGFCRMFWCCFCHQQSTTSRPMSNVRRSLYFMCVVHVMWPKKCGLGSGHGTCFVVARNKSNIKWHTMNSQRNESVVYLKLWPVLIDGFAEFPHTVGSQQQQKTIFMCHLINIISQSLATH